MVMTRYLRSMIVDVKAKGGVPILSGMVNRNYWTGEVLQSQWPFADYAQQVFLHTLPASMKTKTAKNPRWLLKLALSILITQSTQ